MKYRLLPLLLTALAMPAMAQVVTLDAQQMVASGIHTAVPEPVTRVLGAPWPARVIAAPDGERVIAAPFAGLVEQIMAAEGDTVQMGQPLLRLRSPDLVALLAEHDQAAALDRLASQQLKRDRDLYAEGIIAARRVQESEAHHGESSARLKAARDRLGMVGVDSSALSDLRKSQGALLVRAPQDGIILERIAKPGQRLMEADALLRMADGSRLAIEMQLPVADSLKMAPSQHLHIGANGDAVITHIGWQTAQSSQTVTVRADLVTSDAPLRPGQMIEARAVLTAASTAFRLPASAVLHEGSKAYVYVQEPKGFRRLDVQELESDGIHSTVSGELTTESRVASTGLTALKAAAQGAGGEG